MTTPIDDFQAFVKLVEGSGMSTYEFQQFIAQIIATQRDHEARLVAGGL